MGNRAVLSCAQERLQGRNAATVDVRALGACVDAVHGGVAAHIARLMRLGRTCADLEAELLFERDEWAAAFILNKRRPPKTAPPLNEVVHLVAKHGGFLERKTDGEPGVKSKNDPAGDAAHCSRHRGTQGCTADQK